MPVPIPGNIADPIDAPSMRPATPPPTASAALSTAFAIIFPIESAIPMAFLISPSVILKRKHVVPLYFSANSPTLAILNPFPAN